MDDAALRRAIEGFLAGHHVVTLATVGGDGAPHATSLLYATRGLALVWTSKPCTRHSTHLASAPRVSATVAPDTADFAAIRGVRIVGTARRLDDPAEAAAGRAALEARYPTLAGEGAPAGVREAWAKAAIYQLDPVAFTWIDNAAGFGAQRELRVS